MNLRQLLRRYAPLTEDAGQPVEQAEYDPALEPAPLGDVIRRGMAADRLLNDPTWAEAVDELRKEAYAAWFDTKPDDRDAREALYRDAHALERMVTKLIKYRAFGRMRIGQADAA